MKNWTDAEVAEAQATLDAQEQVLLAGRWVAGDPASWLENDDEDEKQEGAVAACQVVRAKLHRVKNTDVDWDIDYYWQTEVEEIETDCLARSAMQVGAARLGWPVKVAPYKVYAGPVPATNEDIADQRNWEWGPFHSDNLIALNDGEEENHYRSAGDPLDVIREAKLVLKECFGEA